MSIDVHKAMHRITSKCMRLVMKVSLKIEYCNIFLIKSCTLCLEYLLICLLGINVIPQIIGGLLISRLLARSSNLQLPHSARSPFMAGQN